MAISATTSSYEQLARSAAGVSSFGFVDLSAFAKLGMNLVAALLTSWVMGRLQRIVFATIFGKQNQGFIKRYYLSF